MNFTPARSVAPLRIHSQELTGEVMWSVGSATRQRRPDRWLPTLHTSQFPTTAQPKRLEQLSCKLFRLCMKMRRPDRTSEVLLCGSFKVSPARASNRTGVAGRRGRLHASTKTESCYKNGTCTPRGFQCLKRERSRGDSSCLCDWHLADAGLTNRT